jgi:hypothetical protein
MPANNGSFPSRPHKPPVTLRIWQATSDALRDAGAPEGSYLVGEPTDRLHDGKCMVVEYEGNLLTRFAYAQGDLLRLEPRNPKYEPVVAARNRVTFVACILWAEPTIPVGSESLIIAD